MYLQSYYVVFEKWYSGLMSTYGIVAYADAKIITAKDYERFTRRLCKEFCRVQRYDESKISIDVKYINYLGEVTNLDEDDGDYRIIDEINITMSDEEFEKLYSGEQSII